MDSPGCCCCSLILVLPLSLFVVLVVLLFFLILFVVVVLLFQGVVAGGVGCGLANYPGVYVRWDSAAGFGFCQISCRDCREG